MPHPQTQAQELTAIAWARTGGTLAVATAKGNLQLLHLAQRRRVPVVGKHTKRVLAAAWGGEGLLATGGADKTVRAASDAVAVPVCLRCSSAAPAAAVCMAGDGALTCLLPTHPGTLRSR